MCLQKLYILLLLSAGLAITLPVSLEAQLHCEQEIEEQYLLGNFEAALEVAQDCHWNDSVLILPLLGTSAYKVNNYKLAKNLLIRSIERGDTSILALQTLARIYEDEWNFPKAVKYATLYLKLDSNNASEWYRMGMIALKAELALESISAFAKTLNLNPHHFKARVKLSDILLQQKQGQEALPLIQQGLSLDSQNVLLLLQAGRTAYYVDSFSLAIDYYDKARDFIDLPVKHSRFKGIAHYRLNEFEEAITYLKAALVDTDKDYIHYFIGMSHLGLEEEEEAAVHFELALEESYSPRIPLYCDYLAGLHEGSDNWKEAIELYREAYRISGDPKYLIRLALAYERWYEDKRPAMRYLEEYINTGDKDYREFAFGRLNILKEYEHMKKAYEETKAH